MFVNVSEKELYEVEGGGVVTGVLIAGAIVMGTAIVVSGAVVVVGKIAQKLSDWIG